jgi:hypothetical protein
MLTMSRDSRMMTRPAPEAAPAPARAAAPLRPVCAAQPPAAARAPRAARTMGEAWNMAAKSAATGRAPAADAPSGSRAAWLRALLG